MKNLLVVAVAIVGLLFASACFAQCPQCDGQSQGSAGYVSMQSLNVDCAGSQRQGLFQRWRARRAARLSRAASANCVSSYRSQQTSWGGQLTQIAGGSSGLGAGYSATQSSWGN